MGGTFNPIHIGHLILAETARTQYELDEILFIPSGKSYMKQQMDIPAGEVRATMTSLAIEDNPYFALSLIEIEREGNTYTFETLEELHQLYSNAELFFLVGADCLFTIERWYQPQRIFDNCTLLAANRNDVPQKELLEKKQFLENRFHAKVVLLDVPQIDISSTKVRDNVKQGKSIRYMVTNQVHDYILQNNYYREVN